MGPAGLPVVAACLTGVLVLLLAAGVFTVLIWGRGAAMAKDAQGSKARHALTAIEERGTVYVGNTVTRAYVILSLDGFKHRHEFTMPMTLGDPFQRGTVVRVTYHIEKSGTMYLGRMSPSSMSRCR
jgi:hypothetical protein